MMRGQGRMEKGEVMGIGLVFWGLKDYGLGVWMAC